MPPFLRLLLTCVILLVLWFGLAGYGLASGGFGPAQRPWGMAGYLFSILLACAILIQRTFCLCCNKRRRVRQPSPEGLAFGSTLIALAAAILIGLLANPQPSRSPDPGILWGLGLVVGLVAAILIISGLVICRSRCRKEGRQPEGEDLPDRAWLLPDPWLYSQSWARTTGAPVTWDNPSISIFDPDTNQEVERLDLVVGKDYRFLFEIQNGSPLVPAPVSARGTRMALELRRFGIGGISVAWLVPPSSAIVVPDIPRTPLAGGDPESVVVVDRMLRFPKPGHSCLRAILQHPDDANPLNNTGQHNLEVKNARAGEQAVFSIPIWNRAPDPRPLFDPKPPRTMQRAIAGLRRTLAPLIWVWERPFVWVNRARYNDLGAKKPRSDQVTIRIQEEATRRGRKLQVGWPARVTPESINIPEVPHDSEASPHEITLSVDVPPDAEPGHSAAFTVMAFNDEELLGGVTCLTVVSEGGR